MWLFVDDMHPADPFDADHLSKIYAISQYDERFEPLPGAREQFQMLADHLARHPDIARYLMPEARDLLAFWFAQAAFKRRYASAPFWRKPTEAIDTLVRECKRTHNQRVEAERQYELERPAREAELAQHRRDWRSARRRKLAAAVAIVLGWFAGAPAIALWLDIHPDGPSYERFFLLYVAISAGAAILWERGKH